MGMVDSAVKRFLMPAMYCALRVSILGRLVNVMAIVLVFFGREGAPAATNVPGRSALHRG
jgi:hypothetical protein